MSKNHSPRIYSDRELGLPSLWFTGQQWADGTAAKVHRKQYQKKVEEKNKLEPVYRSESEPDWSGKCVVCGESPIVPATGMCGPCTFGDASTVGGNW